MTALLPSLAVSVAVRNAPADVDPAAAPPAATEQLPDPEPWFFVSPKNAANANVVELLISGALLLDWTTCGLQHTVESECARHHEFVRTQSGCNPRPVGSPAAMLLERVPS